MLSSYGAFVVALLVAIVIVVTAILVFFFTTKSPSEASIGFSTHPRPKIVASVTSIPSRMGNCLRDSVASILQQSYPIDEVFIALPTVSLRQGEVGPPPKWTIEPGFERVTVVRCEDEGPATKYRGAAKEILASEADYALIFDDDQVYASSLVRNMVSKDTMDPFAVYQNNFDSECDNGDGCIKGFLGLMVPPSALRVLCSASVPEKCLHTDDQWAAALFNQNGVLIRGTQNRSKRVCFAKHGEDSDELERAEDALHALGKRMERIEACMASVGGKFMSRQWLQGKGVPKTLTCTHNGNLCALSGAKRHWRRMWYCVPTFAEAVKLQVLVKEYLGLPVVVVAFEDTHSHQGAKHNELTTPEPVQESEELLSAVRMGRLAFGTLGLSEEGAVSKQTSGFSSVEVETKWRRKKAWLYRVALPGDVVVVMGADDILDRNTVIEMLTRPKWSMTRTVPPTQPSTRTQVSFAAPWKWLRNQTHFAAVRWAALSRLSSQ